MFYAVNSIIDEMPKKLIIKKILAVLIVFITISAITVYYINKPGLFDELKQTPGYLVALLILFYMFFIGALAVINDATLKLCNKPIEAKESMKVTMYSSFINFFGPLQSGPAFRAIYFKKLHNVDLKKFTLATIAYYAFYALISGAFLLTSTLRWYLAPILIIASVVSFFSINSSAKLLEKIGILNLKFLPYLGWATLLQLSIQVLIYYFELKSLVPSLGIGQVLAYTGAANFALFISFTPGALGFRESFLLFSQKIHHIDSSSIVVATTLDRAVYIIVLLIIGVYIFGANIQKQFKGLGQTVD